MFKRALSLRNAIKNRSVFLLGPRQTGKTTLLKKSFPEARWFNLLEADTYRELAARPETIRQSLRQSDRIVIVDEIQKIPGLLDEVHLLIESNKNLRFILTGSSARRLKEKGVNLLAGRARTLQLHPLTTDEISSEGEKGFWRLLNVGGLPGIFSSEEAEKDLKAYVGTYLQEEIRAEGLVRSTERFSRFLEISGLSNGQIINFSKVGSDAGVPPRTVIEYFRILEDTLLGTLLPPFQLTKKRKAVASSKFFLFDLGVANQLLKRRSVEPDSESLGAALEHLLFMELRSYLDYQDLDHDLCFWRTPSQQEVDFVIGAKLAVEVKASRRVDSSDFRSLIALSEEFPKMRKVLVCRESRYRKTEAGIEIFPLREFLENLWKGEFL